ncbi:MAG: SH3 domain-containing protein [Spirochaetaceae bacterium]|jgi:hypothetical protein|nr:SH3 domain-containing protein [Spirochaetaceae bacterium]
MKVRVFVVCVLSVLAVLLTAGCAKKTAVETVEAEEVVVVENAAPRDAGFGYTMRVGMWLYVIESDTGAKTDVTKAVESLPLGEKVRLVEEETRKAVNPYDGQIYDYYRVRRDTGSEGFVFANQLTVNSVPAVVVDEKANLYRSPRNVDATDYILSRKTVFGVLQDTEKDGFIRIEAYDPEKQAYRRNLFIKTSAISYRDEDIQSSILLQIAEALDPAKEVNRREALLESAVKDYPGSIFAEEIRALSAPDSAVPAEVIDATLFVTDDKVNVRGAPNASAPVIAQLANNTEVKAVGVSVDDFVVGGQTARWFHIAQPVDGWVFGAWLRSGRADDN